MKIVIVWYVTVIPDQHNPVPPELGNLANLAKQWLDHNELTGRIPPELGSLTDLDNLRLHYNNLTGPVPPELGNLAELWELLLSWNELTGPIPAELGNLSRLGKLVRGPQQAVRTASHQPPEYLAPVVLVAHQREVVRTRHSCVPDVAGRDLRASAGTLLLSRLMFNDPYDQELA